MQRNVQQQLINELSQLRATLSSAEASVPREKPDANPGMPRSALDLARTSRELGTRRGHPKSVGELAQRRLPLLDD